jgi:undecaprenyl diphosphate synthase
VQEGRIAVADIDEPMLASALSTAGMPDPDLVIRTSGELRLSNFLLWQAAYAELVFLDVLWPDFGASHFAAALAEYARRERRFGARPS